MSDSTPVLNQLNLVVLDMDATLAFYRQREPVDGGRGAIGFSLESCAAVDERYRAA
jgi:hypothetical protein